MVDVNKLTGIFCAGPARSRNEGGEALSDTVNNTIFVHRSYWGRCRMADRLFITTVLGLQMAAPGVRRAYRWSRQWVRNCLP